MKYTLVTVAALASCLALNAAAQSPAVSAAAPSAPAVPAGPPKIAVISFQEAVAQTNDFQRRFADLQEKYDPNGSRSRPSPTRSPACRRNSRLSPPTLSDAERASKAKLLDDKQKELKRTGEDAQTDFQGDMQQTFAAVAGKFVESMDAYAVDMGSASCSTTATSSFLWFSTATLRLTSPRPSSTPTTSNRESQRLSMRSRRSRSQGNSSRKEPRRSQANHRSLSKTSLS